MPTLPAVIVTLLLPFEHLFDPRTWRKAQLLAMGAILSLGKRTVSSALNTLGVGQHGDFDVYHHVLNRARWSPLQLSRALSLLVAGRLGSSTEPLVFGIDETVERRWGRKIAAKGRYRDPVRSTDDQVVMTPGLQWVSLMLLTRIGWAGRHWALPFLTALVVSARYDRRKGRRHQTFTDYAQQMLVCLRRWLPDRDLVDDDKEQEGQRFEELCQDRLWDRGTAARLAGYAFPEHFTVEVRVLGTVEVSRLVLQQFGSLLAAGTLVIPVLERIRFVLGHHVLIHRLVQQPVHGLGIGGHRFFHSEGTHPIGPAGQPLRQGVGAVGFGFGCDLTDSGAGFVLRRLRLRRRSREIDGKAGIRGVSDRLLAQWREFGLLALVGRKQGAGGQGDCQQNRSGDQRQPMFAESGIDDRHGALSSTRQSTEVTLDSPRQPCRGL